MECGARVGKRLRGWRPRHFLLVPAAYMLYRSGAMRGQTPIIPFPKNLSVLHDRDTFTIRRRWFSAAAIFLVFFALFWNAFMVVWMVIAFSSGLWPMAAFGSLHALVGVGVGYTALAMLVNKTDVSVSPYYLGVRHYPLPWGGSKRVRVDLIKQLFVKEKVVQGKNGTSVTYGLFMIVQGDREEKLLTGLKEVSQAHFIEREIEAILGLKDIPVSGEYRRA